MCTSDRHLTKQPEATPQADAQKINATKNCNTHMAYDMWQN